MPATPFEEKLFNLGTRSEGGGVLNQGRMDGGRYEVVLGLEGSQKTTKAEVSFLIMTCKSEGITTQPLLRSSYNAGAN